MRFIDDYLNNITMYRLVLDYLIYLVIISLLFSFFHILPYDPLFLLLHITVIVLTCLVVNLLFSRVLKVAVNIESVFITALILILVISPVQNFTQVAPIFFASVFAMLSKYLIVINKKHIFNPAGVGIFLMSLLLNKSASWWVGGVSMSLFVLLGGVFIIRKIRKFDMVFYFILAAVSVILAFSIPEGHGLIITLQKIFLHSPILFFAFVMLTEPLTTPPTKNLQIAYGIITGIVFAPQLHLGEIYFTPEMALLFGNAFSFIVSPKFRMDLVLTDKIEVTKDIYDFIFIPSKNSKRLKYKPGQYLEWTLPVKKPDDRGNRRFFTIASSPTESNLRIGVKFNKHSSSYKKVLLELKEGDSIVGNQLMGDFTLPKDKNKKLVFIAGGIGITPFRSMIKYLSDSKEIRDIILLYSNKIYEEIVYKDIFDEAERKLNIRIIYTLTDVDRAPFEWNGELGYINKEMIQEHIPDYSERMFYVSGPHSMVEVMKDILKDMKIKKIVTDYFPGFA